MDTQITEILKERPGLVIGLNAAGNIVQTATGMAEYEELLNEMNVLERLTRNGLSIGPKPLDRTVNLLPSPSLSLETENLAPRASSAIVTNMPVLYRAIVRFISELTASNYIHGDLTSPNIYIMPATSDYEYHIKAVDWKQAVTVEDVLNGRALPKRSEPDSWQLLNTILARGQHDPHRYMRKWKIIRKEIPNHYFWGHYGFADLGCHDGWYVAMAAAEGMTAIGVDWDKAALDVLRNWWPFQPGYRPLSIYHDLGTLPESEHQWEKGQVGLCLSTYEWIAYYHSYEVADAFIAWMATHFEMFFFETQLAGDGIGQVFDDDKAVRGFLSMFGEVHWCGSVDIEGRNTYRSIWKVTP